MSIFRGVRTKFVLVGAVLAAVLAAGTGTAMAVASGASGGPAKTVTFFSDHPLTHTVPVCALPPQAQKQARPGSHPAPCPRHAQR